MLHQQFILSTLLILIFFEDKQDKKIVKSTKIGHLK